MCMLTSCHSQMVWCHFLKTFTIITHLNHGCTRFHSRYLNRIWIWTSATEVFSPTDESYMQIFIMNDTTGTKSNRTCNQQQRSKTAWNYRTHNRYRIRIPLEPLKVITQFICLQKSNFRNMKFDPSTEKITILMRSLCFWYPLFAAQ